MWMDFHNMRKIQLFVLSVEKERALRLDSGCHKKVESLRLFGKTNQVLK